MINAESLLSEEVEFQIAASFLTALKGRNWRMMRAMLTDDASWTLPGKSELSGEARGADAVVERARQLRDYGVMVELTYILYGMHGVALSLHNTGGRGDLKLDEHVVIVLDLEDTRIAKMTTYLHDVPGINTFFVEGII